MFCYVGFSATHQCHTTEQDHSDDGSLEIFIFDQLVGFQSEVRPSLPEGGVIVASEEGKPLVTIIRTTVSRIFSQEDILGVGIKDNIHGWDLLSFFLLSHLPFGIQVLFARILLLLSVEALQAALMAVVLVGPVFVAAVRIDTGNKRQRLKRPFDMIRMKGWAAKRNQSILGIETSPGAVYERNIVGYVLPHRLSIREMEFGSL